MKAPETPIYRTVVRLIIIFHAGFGTGIRHTSLSTLFAFHFVLPQTTRFAFRFLPGIFPGHVSSSLILMPNFNIKLDSLGGYYCHVMSSLLSDQQNFHKKIDAVLETVLSRLTPLALHTKGIKSFV
jgi:hypothetical protein